MVPDKPEDSPDVASVLRNCRLDGLKLYIPPGQLAPALYAKVKKEILIWGGKWNTSGQCFVFKKIPADKLEHFRATGQVINEKKDRQAFYTPFDIVDRMIDYACITQFHDVLEPSAGNGAIALACVAAGAASVTCCELDPDECETLRMTGKFAAVLQGDFLEADLYTGDHPSKFERILMNPPFTKGQDVAHILAAYEYLATGGRLVAIIPDKDSPRLAHLRPETLETLPAGAFKESGTNVATRIIQILS